MSRARTTPDELERAGVCGERRAEREGERHNASLLPITSEHRRARHEQYVVQVQYY
jgi:hypothetical protein